MTCCQNSTGLLVAVLAVSGLSCLAPGEPYPHDNPYDREYGTFILTCNSDDEGVRLAWTMPSYMTGEDVFVVFVDDELDRDFRKLAVLDWQTRKYLDPRPLELNQARDYLVGVRKEEKPVPGTSNWVHCVGR